MTEMFVNSISRDYKKLAKVMCKLQEILDNSKSILLVHNQEKQKELNSLLKNARTSILQTV